MKSPRAFHPASLQGAFFSHGRLAPHWLGCSLRLRLLTCSCDAAMKLKLVGGLVAFLLALVVVLIVTPREPKNEGRTLSRWLEDLDLHQPGYDRSKARRARDAVRDIGACAVPTLITMMRYRESSYREPWTVHMTRFFAKQKVIQVKAPPPAKPPSADQIHWLALQGAWIIGPKAEATIPDIIPLLTNQIPRVRAAAARALGHIGPSAGRTIPLLAHALEDPNLEVRNCGMMALAALGPVAQSALPAVRRHFDDTNTMNLQAMDTFLSITNGSPEVLPYLVQELKGPNRGWAVSMLRSLGKEGRSALPELSVLLSDSDKNVRRAVTNTLNTIGSNEPPYLRSSSNSFAFSNTSFKEVLEFYGRLTGKRIELDPEIQSSVSVTIRPYGLRNAEEGARWIEEDLCEQANLLLTPASNGTVFVRYKK